MRGIFAIFLMAMASSAAAAQQPSVAEIAKVKAVMDWAQGLLIFHGAKPVELEHGNALGMYILLLSGPYNMPTLEVSSVGGEMKATFYELSWTDHDAVFLHALSKRVGGSAGEPVTPDAAIQAHLSGRDIEQYLDAGKLDFGYEDEGSHVCPWKSPGCFSAEIEAL